MSPLLTARAATWRQRLDRLARPGSRRIGVVWAGRPAHNNDRMRSATLAAFAPIASLPNVTLVSLQKGPAADQVGRYYGIAPLLNLAAEINDFEDTMAILETLDLLVTVDTAVAHLAGALGRPAFVAIAYAPDWRWLLGRYDTPWYSSVRLFRQTTPGRWDDLMQDMATRAVETLT